MIYLDNGATSFPKPLKVRKAVISAMDTCGNPGRGGHRAAAEAEKILYECREQAGRLFHCEPEQVVLTGNCTQGLNIAIGSLFRKGDRVVISGFEHNAVTRTLYGLGIHPVVAGTKLFDWQDTLAAFGDALDQKPAGAVFTHVSNVFGYILPVREMAAMCAERNLPFILDAAQSAGTEDIHFSELGADFIAMPGHKGLLGPMGTGLLLCKDGGKPVFYGGTGTQSLLQSMPDFLPEALEPGTPNIPGIAGLRAGLALVSRKTPQSIGSKERALAEKAALGLEKLRLRVFWGPHQGGTVSFLPRGDCEEMAAFLAKENIAVRAGLHCAPLAHKSAGTLSSGTVRVSMGPETKDGEIEAFLQAVSKGSS